MSQAPKSPNQLRFHVTAACSKTTAAGAAHVETLCHQEFYRCRAIRVLRYVCEWEIVDAVEEVMNSIGVWGETHMGLAR